MSDSESDDYDDDDIDSQGLIVPIQAKDVQRIVAGQVILDLSSAVKELVDNSLDAGAKSINIRLFNQGIDVIEVSDDGAGIPKASRPLLAMKHATSKILNFDDIYKDTIIDGTVQKSSLGFRGEALFSLANISQNLVVSTKTESEDMGQKLEFKKDGFLDTTKTTDVSRKVGTTVAVVKLFDALPVRRVDLIKRIKNQRQKLIKLIQAYAVLCVGINFTLTDVTGAVGSSTSKTEIKLSTSEKSKSIQETVSSVLGSKFCQGLCPFHLDLSPAVQDMIRNGRVPRSCALNVWKIEGLVSRAPCTEVEGKVARDIQFFSVNGRPVELPTVSRLLSDVWKNFEPTTGDSSKKRPACILVLQLPSCMFDVNVSPDKREVFITEDSIIYDCIRHGLCHLWTSQQRLFNANQGQDSAMESVNAKTPTKPSTPEETTEEERTPCAQPSGIRMKRRNAFINEFHNIGKSTTDNHLGNAEEVVPTSISDFQELLQLRKEDFEMDVIQEPIIHKVTHQESGKRLSNFDNRKWNQTKITFSPGNSSSQREEIHQLHLIQNTMSNNTENKESPDITRRSNNAAPAVSVSPSRFQNGTPYTPHQLHRPKDSQFSSSPSTDEDDDIVRAERNRKRKAPVISRHRISEDMHENVEDKAISFKPHHGHSEDDVIWYNFSGTESVLSQSKAAIASSNARKKYIEKMQSTRSLTHDDSHQDKGLNSSGKTISLAKDDFVTMTILGQFNLGFILALCNSGHLWILDQHACDEKYNFEKLCKETRVHEQKLLAPLPLELSPSEENCVLENLDIFEQNGFKFQYDDTKAIRHRLSLTTIPHNSSGGDGRTPVTFGAEDVGALCALLGADGESSSSGFIAGSGTGADGRGSSGNNAVRRHAGSVGGVIRLPKSIALFASRACRSSVMIGEALNKNKMDEIVKRLRELEQPWTCAHGRPTIRHIRDMLDDLLDDENV
jgi:DNA mismatch repair protein PMS2